MIDASFCKVWCETNSVEIFGRKSENVFRKEKLRNKGAFNRATYMYSTSSLIPNLVLKIYFILHKNSSQTPMNKPSKNTKMYLKHWISCNVRLVFCRFQIVYLFRWRKLLEKINETIGGYHPLNVSSSNTDNVKSCS